MITKQAVALVDFYSLYVLLVASSRFVGFGLMISAIVLST